MNPDNSDTEVAVGSPSDTAFHLGGKTAISSSVLCNLCADRLAHPRLRPFAKTELGFALGSLHRICQSLAGWTLMLGYGSDLTSSQASAPSEASAPRSSGSPMAPAMKQAET